MQIMFQPNATAQARQQLDLAELVGSLSFALDLTEGQPRGHCVRCCYIGTLMGRALGLEGEALSDLYYTLLLKDLGCTSNAARVCELFLTDDISFKHDFKQVDGSLSSALRFVFSKTGLKAGLSDRIRAIVRVAREGGEIAQELIETRCHRGADIAAKMRFSEAVQSGIRALDEHWNGQGRPDRLRGAAIPQNANIALIAQVADVFHSAKGPGDALAQIVDRSGSWFSPQLAETFGDVQAVAGFWEQLADPDLPDLVFSMLPAKKTITVDEDYLDDVASAFADVVDAKSSFTADHSNRVTLYADMIAEELGLDGGHRRWLRRASLLHDIGKLAISNQVLDKPGKLDDAEWQAMRSHPLHSERILARVDAFTDIAPLTGAHHERLDGKGYPYGLAADQLCLEARILTVADVFDALSAERPYRGAMPIAKCFEILDGDTGTAFDGDCVSALRQGLARLDRPEAA